MSGYKGPAIDHSLISPNGRISKRTKAAAIKRHAAESKAWFDEKHPQPTDAEKAESKRLATIKALTHHAERLEAFAANGYRVRFHNNHAAKVRAEIESLQND